MNNLAEEYCVFTPHFLSCYNETMYRQTSWLEEPYL